MKFPKLVKLFWRDYTVTPLSAGAALATQTSFGKVNFVTGEITYTSVSDAEDANTILHEIMHVIVKNYQLEDEEKIVTSVTNGLTTVIRDNPKLFKILEKMINGKRANISNS